MSHISKAIDLLQNFDNQSDVHLVGEVRLVHRISKDRGQTYLHELFESATETDLMEVESILGFPIPSEYRTLLKHFCGANLFDRMIFVYGNINIVERSNSAGYAMPLYLGFEALKFRSLHPGSNLCPVISISTWSKTYDLLIDEAGQCYLKDETRTSGFLGDFGKFFGMITEIFNGFIDEFGISDSNALAIQGIIDGYIYKDRLN